MTQVKSFVVRKYSVKQSSLLAETVPLTAWQLCWTSEEHTLSGLWEDTQHLLPWDPKGSILVILAQGWLFAAPNSVPQSEELCATHVFLVIRLSEIA